MTQKTNWTWQGAPDEPRQSASNTQTQNQNRNRSTNQKKQDWASLQNFKPGERWLYPMVGLVVIAAAAVYQTQRGRLEAWIANGNLIPMVSIGAIGVGAIGLIWLLRNRSKVDATSANQLLYWLSVALLLAFMGVNIAPYYRSVLFLFAQVFGGTGSDPATAAFSSVFAGVFGVILWATLQTFQIYPMLLRHNRRMLQVMLREAEQAGKFQVNDWDDPTVKGLKRWYNQLPTLSAKVARQARVWAYTVDLIICLAVYPVVDSASFIDGIVQIMIAVLTFDFARINAGNIAIILSTLFIVEFLLALVLHLGAQSYYWKESRKEA